jgi:NAD(P)H-flavin reductase
VTEVAEITRLTRDVRGLRLRLLDPGSIRFTAGQFVTVEVPGTAATRAFSMASPPSESGFIELVVRVLPGGAFSAALDERLAPGDRLRVSGPFGQLKVRLSHRPIIMIAGGSGLAPIESMSADLADRRNTRPVTVFFGAERLRRLPARPAAVIGAAVELVTRRGSASAQCVLRRVRADGLSGPLGLIPRPRSGKRDYLST